jgi:hypothetical protein
MDKNAYWINVPSVPFDQRNSPSPRTATSNFFTNYCTTFTFYCGQTWILTHYCLWNTTRSGRDFFKYHTYLNHLLASTPFVFPDKLFRGNEKKIKTIISSSPSDLFWYLLACSLIFQSLRGSDLRR